MKFGELESIGHNIAHSLASGIGLMIGYFVTDIIEEAAAKSDRCLEVDFLAGRISSGHGSATLKQAVELYSRALDELCTRHGTTRSAFTELKVRYCATGVPHKFTVTIQNEHGRSSVKEFAGFDGEKIMEMDALGRLRPRPSAGPHDPE